MPDSDAADSKIAELSQRLAESERRAQAAEARVADLQHALDAAHARLATFEPPAPEPTPPPEPTPAPEPAPVEALAAADAAGADTEAPAEAEPSPNTSPDAFVDPRDPALVARLEAQHRALYKRGFRRDDLYYHKCTSCGEQAVEKHAVGGKTGGRDIDLCLACGASASWRRRPDREDRELDETFDLATFLR